MQEKHGKPVVGFVLILLGFFWALKSLNLLEFNLFFDGWWTLFLIVPCILGLRDGKSRGKNIVGIFIGVLLLLWRREFISGRYIPAILVALIFIVIGLSIMFREPKESKKTEGNGQEQESKFQQRTYSYSSTAGADAFTNTQWKQQEPKKEEYSEYEYSSQQRSDSREGMQEENTTINRSTFETCPPNIAAILVGKSATCLKGVFRGTSLQSVLGNVQLDLRQAVLEQDVYVNVQIVLGGVDIYLPENARVVCETKGVLGDIRDIRNGKRSQDPTQPAFHIVGICVLGGLELK